MQPASRVGLKRSTSRILLLLGAGVVSSMPVLLTLWGVLFDPMLYTVVAETTSSIVGVLSTCGACTNPVLIVKASLFFAPIIGYVGGSNTRTFLCIMPIFRLLNKLWWEIPSGLPINWIFTSLAFDLFKSFPASFIVTFENVLIRSFMNSLFIVKLTTL